MIECGTVVSVLEENASARVRLSPGEHCGNCTACAAAGTDAVLPAANPVGAQPGDRVELRVNSGFRMKSALLVFLLPLFFFWAGYSAAGAWLGAGEGGGALCGFAAVALYTVILARLDRIWRRRAVFSASIVRVLRD